MKKLFTYVGMVVLYLAFAPGQQGFAGTLYYDTNGSTGGTSTNSTQNFTDTVWTIDPTGSVTTTGYTAGSDIVFSATDGVNVGTGTQAVTVTDTESADGFIFDKGIVTLLGSGSPSLSIGAGGVTVNSTDGATTFDSSLGTVTLSAGQSWNNDSTQALNVNNAVNGSGRTLTFDGTGSGAVNLTGPVSNVNLVQESASSTLYLTNNNSVSSTTISNDGTVVAGGNGSVGGAISFTNGGGTLTFTNVTAFNSTLTETAPSSGTDHGATLNFVGDTVMFGGTNAYTANLLNLGSGDDLDLTTGTQGIATLDLIGNGAINSGHRLIVGFQGQGLGFINGSTINVEDGYTLDFGTSGTINNLINVQSGSAVENRSGGTVTFTNTSLPTSGEVTLGADDVGGGAEDFTAPLALTGDLTIHLQTANPTSVTLGNISGNANLNVTGSRQVNPNGNSVLYLAGTDTYTGSTTLAPYASPPAGTSDYAAIVDITGDSSGVGKTFNIEEGVLDVGSTGKLPTGAIINLGYAANGAVDYFEVGDGNGAANVTVSSINSLSGNGGADKIVGGNASVSNLTVDVASGVDDIYYGNIGTGNGNQANISLTVDGPGILTIVRGDSYFTGGVFIDGAGTLAVGDDPAMGPDSNNVTLTNGGTLYIGTIDPVYGNSGPSDAGGFNHNIILGAGGGTLNGQGDYEIYSTITGGTGLTQTGGDFLSNSGSADDVGTMNVDGGRLLAFSNGIFGNNATFNVGANATLDFGAGGELANTINVADGGSLENRTNAVTLDNVVLPSTGTVTLGSDDSGGGSITIKSNIHLTGSLALDINGVSPNGNYNPTTVNLAGQISGNGPLTINAGPTGNSLLELTGNNNYTGPTTLNGVTVQPGGNGFGTSAITANSSAIDLTGGAFTNSLTAGTGTTNVNLVSNVDQTISGPIELSGNGGTLHFINESTANNLTVGSIDFADYAGGARGLYFDSTSTGMITLDGTYTSLGSNQSNPAVALGSSMQFGIDGNDSGNYTIGADANFSNFETNGLYDGQATLVLNTGNLYIDNSSFVAGQYIAAAYFSGENHTINVVGSQNIQAIAFMGNYSGTLTINQSTADDSTWAGNVNLSDTVYLDVSAVDGGRLNFTGDVGGNNYYQTAGIVKTGAGVVVFGSANGNSYSVSGNGVALDIKQGTALISNTAGYALGNNSGSVNVEKGATFGGNGTLASGQQVISEDATSVIAPGDAGQANLGINPSIGTLTITGGLVTANNADPTTDGLTMDFKLNGDGFFLQSGVNNDFIIASYLNLNGTLTINLTAMDTLLTGSGNIYTLIQDNGDWDGTLTNIIINTPDGYALDPTYGNGLGYVLNQTPGAGTFAVELIAVPEPSTYALVGLGILGLVAIRGRLKNRYSGKNQ